MASPAYAEITVTPQYIEAIPIWDLFNLLFVTVLYTLWVYTFMRLMLALTRHIEQYLSITRKA